MHRGTLQGTMQGLVNDGAGGLPLIWVLFSSQQFKVLEKCDVIGLSLIGHEAMSDHSMTMARCWLARVAERSTASSPLDVDA